ncbi:MAG TPA: AAA family ATPase [Pirellulaceae bacterium]|nr:AAA family ATPase [Pirellulaceae bacterium]HMO93590.1 AAA family ATPase [Pirellulaceae bacterium]HMP70514.1 AAA family ATPase [Pirellulaceae bacterium]
MSSQSATNFHSDLLAQILSDEAFCPTEPASLKETGLPTPFVESLILKRLSLVGTCSGRQLANQLCLPFQGLEAILANLRQRQIIVHGSSAPLNDYNYSLTEIGRERATFAVKQCAYSGPAPVTLIDYVLSAEAQSIRAESPKRKQLMRAFADISIDEGLFESLGPAINSGAGLFLYGEPGNGKSTLARRITQCFGQEIWVPHAIYEDGQIIKLFDSAYHVTADNDEANEFGVKNYDTRWLRIKRPTVVVGGEMTMDSLEIRHDPRSNVSEAPLQLKSNGGCLLIDDFGRQRIEPAELLNRWIIPLENRQDYLTLASGKKIQVPFEQLIIFSTNLDPEKLADEAFLRRIPYKIEIHDPSPEEFHLLFKLYAKKMGFDYRASVVDYLIQEHYRKKNRRLRRCHPRDLLLQTRNYCVYNNCDLEMRTEYFDMAVKSYFTTLMGH